MLVSIFTDRFKGYVYIRGILLSFKVMSVSFWTSTGVNRNKHIFHPQASVPVPDMSIKGWINVLSSAADVNQFPSSMFKAWNQYIVWVHVGSWIQKATYRMGVGRFPVDSELTQYALILSWWSGYHRFDPHLRWGIFCFQTCFARTALRQTGVVASEHVIS